MGGLYWRGPGQLHDNRVQAFEWLINDPQSPWLQNPWPLKDKSEDIPISSPASDTDQNKV